VSPRLTAQDRLTDALQAIGLAFDRDGISIDDAALEMKVPRQQIEAALQPFTDLEYVHTSGGLLDDIGHVVTITDGQIEVQQNWMHDLTSLTPGDAALLLAMIETADNLEGVSIDSLRSLRRRLDVIAHTSIGEAVPASVASLLNAMHAGTVVSARRETPDMAVPDEPTLYEVHEVRWTPNGWRVLVSSYAEGDDDRVLNVAAEKMHDVTQTSHRFERRALTTSEFTSSQRAVDIEISFPIDSSWLLSYFRPEILSEDSGEAVARIRIDPERPLERLLLRLGPDARVLSPSSLVDLGADTARRILSDRYGLRAD
jgi:hypothetical protein